MTEHEEQQPLTRRERRLQEAGGAETLSTPQAPETPRLSEVPGQETQVNGTLAESGISNAPEDGAHAEVEISPLNPDGTIRSRREMRQLREEALAALDRPVSAEPGLAAPASAEAARNFDSLISPPTEAFTVQELQEAQASQPVGTDQSDEDDSAETAPDERESAPALDDASPLPEGEATQPSGEDTKSKRRFWKRGKEPENVGAPVEVAPELAPALVEPIVHEPIVHEPLADEPLADEPLADESSIEEPTSFSEPPAVAVEELPVVEELVEINTSEVVISSVSAEESSAKTQTAYSFPDIVPPEEWRSVFDDPHARATPLSGKRSEESGDFDDLISRAVAQEGAAGTSNTSALILPAMPADTGGLKGPLGGTGELYLTGSIELPKSLGETGGHSALHDSIEIDPITGSEPEELNSTADHGPVPVAARSAVSARVLSGTPVVAKPTKERSKLPLVLTLTGGGLLVTVVGVGVWVVSTGVIK